MKHSISAIVMTLLTVSYVAASGLTISGVYYDPVQAENGGEAVQIENVGTTPLDLSLFALATKATTFPLPALTLLPGQAFLIADSGWDTLRDNVSWPLADYMIGLSLANTAGFVELIDAQSNSLDRLEWNSSNGSKARESYLFTHDGEAMPVFRNMNTTSLSVPATIIINNAVPSIASISVTDDASTPGIQLLSFDRTVAVTVLADDANGDALNVTIDWFGGQYDLLWNASVNATTARYSATLPFTKQAPGDYQASITVHDGITQSSQQITITVLSSTSITTTGSLVLQGAPGANVSGSFGVQNEGNVVKTITIDQSIPGVQCDATDFALAPDEEKTITCTATLPASPAGSYAYTVRIIAS